MMFAMIYVAVMVCVPPFSTALDINSEVCLQRALEFPGKLNQCNFIGDFAENHFNEDPYGNTCQTKCIVTMQNLRDDWNILLRINLTIIDKSVNTVCSPRWRSQHMKDLYINCPVFDEYAILYGQYCRKRDAYCSKLDQTCICQCLPGYLMVNGHCLTANVELHKPCLSDRQCTGNVPYAVCSKGLCSCQHGYLSKDGTCYQGLPANENEAFLGNQNHKEGSLGSTLGALFGGVLLGVLITTVIGFIIYKRSQQNYKTRQTEEPTVVFADNNAYGNARIQGNADNATRNNKNNQRQIVNVPPYAPSNESPEYGNVSQTSRTKRANEDIYNHLNEKEKPDDDDNYDHACAATGHTRGNFVDSDYSSMRDVDKGYGSSVAKGTGD
uniref:Uncharacterized protein LOC111108749 isoform X3 n=1 Tax=Crassostrea virginica TaxID=6565 RepID=A0A8B8BBF3_CRAVI|nr:uncharacterized protein LOC111108749 isoform X3 [Crassostrea virginica]